MLSEGRYMARAVDGALGTSTNGNDQVTVELRTFDEKGEGESVLWYGYFTDRAIGMTLKALRTMGWTGDDLSDLSTLGSKDVEIVLEEEIDNRGNARLRVKWINEPGAGRLKRAEPDVAKTIAARHLGAVVAHRQAMGMPAPQRAAAPRPAYQRPPTSAPAPTGVGDDNMPF